MRVSLVVFLLVAGVGGCLYSAVAVAFIDRWALDPWYPRASVCLLVAGVILAQLPLARKVRGASEQLRNQREEVYPHLYDSASERVQKRAR